MPEIVDDIVPVSSVTRGGVMARPVISETVALGSLDARPDTSSSSVDEAVPLAGARVGRSLSDGARKMLANIDKHGSVDDVETTPAETSAPAAAEQPAAAAMPSAPAAAETPAPVEAPPPAEHEDVAARLSKRNQELLAEVETLRSTKSKRELSKREQTLDEAERMWTEDSIGAIRRIAALAIGAEDPNSPEVDKQMSWLYHDLTEKELNVPLDPNVKSLRESERTRLMVARDKRERDAAAAAPTEPVADKQFTEHAELVGRHITASKHAEKYPLLMSLAEDFDAAKPEALILKAIHRGFATGELDPRTTDDKLIEAASRRIEDRYQALADKILKARPSTSTAAPTPAPAANASPTNGAAGQSHGTRTITAASASVAPATPPAPKTEPQTEASPPKYRNEKERRAALARKHFPS